MFNKVLQFYTISEMCPQIKWLILTFVVVVAIALLFEFILNNIGKETDGVVLFEINIPLMKNHKEQTNSVEETHKEQITMEENSTTVFLQHCINILRG